MRAGAGRNLLLGATGLAAGGLFMWLALRNTDAAELRALVATLDYSLLLAAAAAYWTALTLRIFRWQTLLRELAPAPLRLVAETLIVGYAVNNVLPARLGEVARAAYAKRRLRIGHARVFGSIVIERLLDLIAILACLAAGLFFLRFNAGVNRLPVFEIVAINAGIVIGAVILGIAVLRMGVVGRIQVPQKLRIIVQDFLHGINTLNRRSLLLGIVLTSVIWGFEALALGQAFHAVGVDLSVTQALLLMGAVSLSTLVPTAPGYLGTFQLVAVIAMTAFGFSESAGIVAASAIQVVLYGSVTVAGALLVLARAAARTLDISGGLQSASENGVKSVSSSK